MSQIRSESRSLADPATEEHLILVDVHDRPIGTAEKLQVHREGTLHRAFSVFVTDSRGRMLLQRRAEGKYHSAGLWSNSCCSHPRPGEETEVAAHRRLREEMGFDCPLEHAFDFVYRVELEGGLSEHEYDHVYVGRCDAEPRPDPEEVSGWRWVEPEALRAEMAEHPERFTYWFRIAMEKLRERGMF